MSVIGLAPLQARWQAAPPVAIFLIAVMITTRVAGAKPGLVALAVVSCYVVWVTATERTRADSLR